MPSEPTLAEFAEAFEAVWKVYPDAPRLPGRYFIAKSGEFMGLGIPEDHMACPGAAALALCVTTAMRVMLNYRRYSADKPRIGFRHPPGHEEGVEFFHGDESRIVADIESASLAALRAIAGADGGEVG